MSLTGIIPRSLGTTLGRSSSCEDLSGGVQAGRDGIQLFFATPGRNPPARMLQTEVISSVNLKIKGPSRGFYSKQHCITSGTSSSSESPQVLHDAASDRMQFVLGLSDLLRISVSTINGKEYAYSTEQTSCSSVVEETSEDEAEWEGRTNDQLVPPVGRMSQSAHNLLACVDSQQSLHLVAERSRSKIYFRASDKGTALELSVYAAPTISDRATSNRTYGRTSPIASPEQVLLTKVEDGLTAGFLPELTEEGTGGTYFMSGKDGEKVAVFKPVDEEPLALNCPRGMTPSATGEGLKKGTRIGEGAFREVAAYLLDYASSSVSKGEKCDGSATTGFSGVPRTMLARCNDSFFTPALEQSGLSGRASLFMNGGDIIPTASKLGSLQEFIPAFSNCEDMGPKNFPVNEVHKIAVLDMRLANTDRNGANILVQRIGSSYKLIPIDHGYCLPESLEECTFEWLCWAQAKARFDSETLDYIARLDAEEDIELLRSCGWDMSPAAACTLRASTMLLKKGAALGLTPFDIGNLMVRSDPSRPCALEMMVEEAEAAVDREGSDFSAALAQVMDQELAAANH